MSSEAQRLYIVRHGVTDWNQAMRMQGHSDVPLNDEGHVQAERIAARLAAVNPPIDSVWTSDLTRARQTAEAIAAPMNLPVRVTPLLREIMLGDWEGLNQQDIEARGEGDLLKQYRTSPHGARPPRGETLEAAWNRMMLARDQIGSEYPTGAVVVVGHGGTLRALLCSALEAPVTSMLRFSLGNASLSIIDETRSNGVLVRRVVSVNDVAHLLC